MSNILLVTSSIHGDRAVSHRVARDIVALWQAKGPATVVERHLTAATIPHITDESFAAAGTPADKRTDDQAKAAALADAIIEEAEAADVIVIAAPMYNFSIPSTLKAWIDHLARAGRTFKYGANGPVGQLTGKKVYVVEGRGGAYGSAPWNAYDHQQPYLKTVLGFVGLDDVTFVPVENQARGGDAAAAGLAVTKTQVAAIATDVRQNIKIAA